MLLSDLNFTAISLQPSLGPASHGPIRFRPEKGN